jgi:microcystin-dependent protein
MPFPSFSVGELVTSADQNTIVSYLSPTGSVIAFAGSTAPTNWLLCNGTTVSRTTYAALFALIGTTYNTGGEAGTDFRLPNLLGRVPVGLDAGQAEFDALAETGGAKTHTLTTTEIPSHTHAQNNFGVAPVAGGFPTANGFVQGGAGADAQGGGRGNGNTGGGGAHNNLQPYLVLNYIIKT